MLGIIASRADTASMNIARAIIDVADESLAFDDRDRYALSGVELRVVDELHIELTDVDDRFAGEPDWIAVVSRHAGDTGPLLTAHFPGNVATADFGGTAYTLPPACPGPLRAYLEELAAGCPPGYDIGLECTHHGPTDVDRPIMFVEIGSDRPQWEDRDAALAVARALWAVRSSPPDAPRQLVGFGGGHYAPRFQRILRDTDWAVGHIAADWALDAVGPDELDEVITSVFECSRSTHGLVDGDDGLERRLEALGFTPVSEAWLRATTTIDPKHLARLERAIEPVDEGLAIGAVELPDDGSFELREVPADLVRTCSRIDREATWSALERRAIAFGTDEEGTVPAGHIAVAPGAALDAVVDDLLGILERKYDAVTRRDDTIRCGRTVFDPDRATALGVPEGPLFGRLAEGEQVELDGEPIDPERVTKRETVELHLGDFV